MKKVFIVTINYKGHKNTLELLESLRKIKKDFELSVIIVDNFPADQIKIDQGKYNDLNLKVIYNKVNLGFSGGNNVGIDYALKNGADYVLVLNNDTLVDPNFLTELILALDAPNAGIAVPKIYFAKGYEYHKKYETSDLGKVFWYAGGIIDWNNVIGHHRGVDEVDEGQYDNTEKTELATGCCMLIKREVLDKVKGYDERYFLYYEDADLGERVKKEGYDLIFEPKSKIWHKNAQSTGGSGSDLQDYFITRNRLMFGVSFAPLRSRIALIRESLRFIKSGRKWQKKGALDFYFRKFGKGSYDL
jgi:GT2 family glycosyltransferase